MADIKSDSSLGGGFEVLVAEGEMEMKKGKYDMQSESLCALVAMKPSVLKVRVGREIRALTGERRRSVSNVTNAAPTLSLLVAARDH